MRERIFQMLDDERENDRLNNLYDVFMMVTIIVSLIPLAFKTENRVFFWIDKVSMVLFIIDYVLRFITADYKLGRKRLSFLLYPGTPMAIVDLFCILPSLNLVQHGFRILKVFRLFRTLRVFRVFKAVRYSKSIRMIREVFSQQRKALITVGLLAGAYVLISALVVFNVEPEPFKTFFDAVYWATVSLTTVGYGDIYPKTTVGRIVTMVSSVFGIAIIALPSGIITAGVMDQLKRERAEQQAQQYAQDDTEDDIGDE